MKNLIKINYLTYFFIISAILCGMFKECIVLMVIIIIHELGHIVAIKYFKYDIKYIEIFPFGGITKIEKDINSSINHEIIISICGVLMQLVIFILISFGYHNHLIDYDIYNIFKKYNFSILIFNLLPIIPLDGSIFIKSIIEKIFSFRISSYLIVVISIIVLSVFIYINYRLQLNNYVICFFLLYKIISYIKEYKYLENRFLLERYLNNYNFKKIKRIQNIGDISKERLSYLLIRNKLLDEKEILNKYFRIHR